MPLRPEGRHKLFGLIWQQLCTLALQRWFVNPEPLLQMKFILRPLKTSLIPTKVCFNNRKRIRLTRFPPMLMADIELRIAPARDSAATRNSAVAGVGAPGIRSQWKCDSPIGGAVTDCGACCSFVHSRPWGNSLRVLTTGR